MKKVGFIGLGIMGKPMSKNLLRAGYDLIVYNRSKEVVRELVGLGAVEAHSPAETAAGADVVITMLPDSPEVIQVALGEKGVIEGARPGLILIDMSSIQPLVARSIAERLEEKGVSMLDAPVSGGEPKAIDGTLAAMVGGSEDVFKACLPLFEAMCTSATLCGEIGAGNVTKLANQIIVAANIAAIGEAFTLATKAGVDPEKVFKAIKGGLAGSTVLNAKLPLVLDRNFQPGFRIKLHIKDLLNTLETAHQVGVPLPLSAALMEMMQSLSVDGCENEDHGALVKYFEKMAHTEIMRLPPERN